MSRESNNLYIFDEFTINLRERNLWRGDVLVPLPPKVFDTLAVLVEKKGATATKDELLNAVWPDAFVEESNLSQNIYTLRRLFGKDRKYIATVPKKGYRFCANVRLHSPEKVSVGSVPVPNPTPDTAGPQHAAVAGSRAFPAGRRRIVGAASVIALTAIVTAAFLLPVDFFDPSAESHSARPRDPGSIELRRLTDSGTAFSPTISPDGRFVAYLDRKGGKQTARLMDIESERDVEVSIEGPAVPGVLEFGPDGKQLYFRTRGLLRTGQRLLRVSYFGGTPRLVAENIWGRFSISPDGEHVAYFRVDIRQNREYLILQDMKSGEERAIHEVTVPDQYFLYVAPAWSPDSRRIAFLPRPAADARSDILIVDVGSGATLAVNTDLQKIFQIVWEPDGNSLLALSKEGDKGRQIWQVDLSGGASRRITNDLNSYAGLSISRDGRKLVSQLRDFRSNVWVFPGKKGAEPKAMTNGQYGHFGLADLEFATEDRVIFEGRTAIDRDLFAYRISDTAETRLTENNGTLNSHIAVTADGRYLYLTSNRSGVPAIWRIGQDGTAPLQITFPEDESHWYPSLSPDEGSLFYLARTRSGNEIRRHILESGTTETILNAEDFAPAHFLEVSPDGRFIAFAYKTDDDEGSESEDAAAVAIRIGILDLKNRVKLSVAEIRATRALVKWTNGGASFDFIRGGTILRQNVADLRSDPEVVFELPNERIYGFDWSFAGKDLAVARGGQMSDLVLMRIGE